jgi:hypothetical protein
MLWTDYKAFYSALIIIVVWIVYIAWVPAWRKEGSIIKPEIAPYFAVLCALVTTICLAILIRRLALLSLVLRKGKEARGRILEVSMRRDRGLVEYTYIFLRKEYQMKVSVHRNKQTLAIRKGDRVMLMVDEADPQRAFIRELYVK